jgi:hypothetical protein
VNGANAAGEHGASSTILSSSPNLSIPSTVSESKTDPDPVNLTGNHTGSGETNSTSLKGQPEHQINSTVVLNQAQLFSDLISAAELNSPPNGTVALVSTDAQKAISRDGDNNDNTGTSSTLVHSKVDGDTRKEDLDVSTKIMNKAMGDGEVLME